MERSLPFRDLCPRFIDHQDPVVRAVVTILPDHAFQALTLPSVLGTGPAHRKLGVAATGLAT